MYIDLYISIYIIYIVYIIYLRLLTQYVELSGRLLQSVNPGDLWDWNSVILKIQTFRCGWRQKKKDTCAIMCSLLYVFLFFTILRDHLFSIKKICNSGVAALHSLLKFAMFTSWMPEIKGEHMGGPACLTSEISIASMVSKEKPGHRWLRKHRLHRIHCCNSESLGGIQCF